MLIRSISGTSTPAPCEWKKKDPDADLRGSIRKFSRDYPRRKKICTRIKMTNSQSGNKIWNRKINFLMELSSSSLIISAKLYSQNDGGREKKIWEFIWIGRVKRFFYSMGSRRKRSVYFWRRGNVFWLGAGPISQSKYRTHIRSHWRGREKLSLAERGFDRRATGRRPVRY